MNMQRLKEEEEDKTIPEEGENVGSGYNTIKERLDYQAIKPKDLIKHPNPKGSDSTLHVYKHESKANEFRAFERQTHKFQTKIRDCRHSRRM